MESSFIIGDIKFSPEAEKQFVSDPKKAETFLFELSELMQSYHVVKVDACLDPFAMLKANKGIPQL